MEAAQGRARTEATVLKEESHTMKKLENVLLSGMTVVVLVMGLALSGCGAGVEEAAGGAELGESQQGECTQLNIVAHYQYSDGSGQYRWDVTFENNSIINPLVDERRIGGGFYRQYRANIWRPCPDNALPETVTLRSGTLWLSGIHNCLPDGREELHGNDKQRVLTKQSPFYTWECSG